jgi:penicillin-binding protein 1A
VAEGRRQQVLKRMLELRLISQAEFDEAFAQAMWLTPFGPPPGPATLVYPPPQAANSSDPYFVDYVRTYVSERYGPEMLYRGGLQIHATLDPRLQAEAQASVDRALAGTGDPLEMSLVSVEPRTGFVRALIGGRDFDVSQVNLALGGTTGMQPGSAFKTFTVAKALEEGYGPDTVYPAPSVLYVPGCGGQCAINGGTGGAIDMAQATSGSVNTYFAQLILDVGPNDVAELANRVGVTRITPDREYNLGLTLGAFEVSPLDMAAGYATIANHGVRAEATPVAYIVVPDGSVLEDNRGPRGTPVLNPAVADWTTQLLRGVVDGGTGKRAAFGRPAAGKTGTAQSNKAAWFVGYTPQLATAVWMGYRDEPRPLRGIGGFGEVYGGTLPAITWQRFMAAAHEPWPVEDFALPGPLPAPSSEIRRVPREAGIPTLPRDCGGPCYSIPVITAPTTTVPPPPEPDPAAPVDVAEGTLPEEPGAGGDIGPAQEPAG